VPAVQFVRLENLPVKSIRVVCGARNFGSWLALCLAFVAMLCSSSSDAGAQTAHFASAQSIVASSGLSNPQGGAVDGSGNVYIADVNNYRVVKIPWTGGSYGAMVTLADRTTNGSIFEPLGVAVDGSGNVYIANGGEGTGSVLKIPWSGSTYGSQITLVDQAPAGTLNFPINVWVDGNGNVYIAWPLQVTKIPWIGSAYGAPITVAASGMNSPDGLAVDGSGNVFIAYNSPSPMTGSVLEVPWNGSSYGTPITLADANTNGGGFNPKGLALDSKENLFVADMGDQKLLEFPRSGTSYGTSVTVANTATNPGFGPFGLAVDGNDNLYIVDSNVTSGSPNNRVLKENLAVANFGTANVGSSGSVTSLIFSFDAAGKIGEPAVVTQGVPNLDFADAGTGTCTTNGTSHNYAIGDTCTVDVTFKPGAPGARYGAAVLKNNSGAVIATGYAQGTGFGSQVSFAPGAQIAVSLPGAANSSALAIDAAGNLYIAEGIVGYDPDNAVVKETWNGSGYTQSVIATGLGYPTGVAVDGAGNVYIADQDNFTVYKETPSNGGYTQSVVDATLGTVGGIAVDGAGNVYVGRGGIGVEKETLSGGSYSRSEIFYTFYAGSIAVDAGGSLYFANDSASGILKETPSGTGYVQSAIGGGNDIYRFAVDGVGNVFFNNGQQIIKETPSGEGYVQSTVADVTLAGTTDIGGIALDQAGNVWFSIYDYNSRSGSVWKIDVIDPPSLSFASTPYGAPSSDSPQTVTIQNTGNAPLDFPVPNSGSNPSISSSFTLNSNASSACPLVNAGSATAGTLAPGNSCELSISFVPATVGTISGSLVLTDDSLNQTNPNYATQSIALGGTATQATPSINWATPTAITYGAELSNSQLDASSPVAGSFSYSPASGTVLTAGQQTLTAMFTPTDTTDYTAATKTVQLTVNQAAPSISWATPTGITYGIGLSNSQLDASSPVAGSFSYSPASGTVLSAGQQTVTATFTPTDTTNYTAATKTVQLTVNQAAPSITWATPAAITFGTGLSATQLNATASVPGTFVYAPAAGAAPALGSDTLSVTFTPTDTTNYSTATASVSLTVNPGLPTLSTLSPAYTSAGGAAFTLTITGAGFVSSSTIYWGATALPTTYASANQLTAQVTAAEIAAAGTAAVTVQTPSPGGGTSSAMTFEVDSASSTSADAPTLTTVAATVAAGATASYLVALPSAVSGVSVSCLNLPANATCSYSSSAGAIAIATSSNTPAGTYQITVVFTETVPVTAEILLPLLLLPLFLMRRRLAAHGAWSTLCLGLIVLTGAVVTIGCGGSSSSSSSGTQTQQVKHSGAVTLTVK